MADIELVIKIPEEMWERVKEGYVPLGISKYLKNATSLPKGHGRLIDADAYKKDMFDSKEFDFFKRLDMQTTIIEAESEEE